MIQQTGVRRSQVFGADPRLKQTLRIRPGRCSSHQWKNEPQPNESACGCRRCAISRFLSAALGDSPILFGRVWLRANGFTEVQFNNFNRARASGGAFLVALVMSANLANVPGRFEDYAPVGHDGGRAGGAWAG